MTMPDRRLGSLLSDQRGIALPLSLIVLALLTSLTLAFLALSSTEPTIAVNLQRGESALAFAEAGIERAIWALSNPTVDTAGVNTKLNNLNAIPAVYSGGTLFQLTAPGGAGPAGAYTVTVTGAGPTTITSHGYVMRNGVLPPALLANLAQSDIAAQRVVRLQVTAGGPNNVVGGPAAGRTGGDVKLPGALTAAGTIQMSGNSLIDGNDAASGTPNGCANKAGATVRDKSPDGTQNNTISCQGNSCNNLSGTPKQQVLSSSPVDNFAPYTFSTAQLAALKALAQQQGQGTYIQPSSSDQFNLTLGNGLTFVDTVNGQALDSPPNSSQLANVKITGGTASGWLIVMGTITIDGDVTYNGFIYAHNDLSYRGTGTGGIYGGILTGNVVDTIANVVDSDGTTGNSKIYYDCNKVANGGGALSQSIQDGLNRVIVTITKGTWRELSN
jgi:hypothetical protein